MFVAAGADTTALDSILDIAESVFANEHGVTFTPTPPVPRAYTSTVEVHAPSVSQTDREVMRLVTKLTELVRGYGIEVNDYGLTALLVGSDQSLHPNNTVKPGRFLFERRVGRPYSDDVYFSEAPVKTAEHLELLRDLEAILTNA